MSGGGSLAKLSGWPVRGWAKPRLAACSAWRGKSSSLLADRLGQRAGGGRDAAQVERIADHRMAAAGEVHADLMGPPGGQPAFQQGDRGAARRAACGSG